MSSAPTPEPTTTEAPQTTGRSHRRRQRFLMRYLRPQMGASVLIWRFEAYTATPIAIALIATVGRWEAALVMGLMMAAYSALFLFLLEGDPILQDLRAWVNQRRFGRIVTWLSEREDGVGRARRAGALVPAIMLTGPFWRAIVFHLFALRRLPAYALSVLGSFPHQLFWTGVVLGSLWEALFKPTLDYVWDEMMMAAFQAVF